MKKKLVTFYKTKSLADLYCFYSIVITADSIYTSSVCSDCKNWSLCITKEKKGQSKDSRMAQWDFLIFSKSNQSITISAKFPALVYLLYNEDF